MSPTRGAPRPFELPEAPPAYKLIRDALTSASAAPEEPPSAEPETYARHPGETLLSLSFPLFRLISVTNVRGSSLSRLQA